jgi:hypothetical protein
MKHVRFVGTVAAMLSLLVAGPVLAAGVANDSYGSREVIAALPFGATVDTSEATSDADDDEANVACGAPATDASIWYEYTAGADGLVALDATGSSYSAGFIVVGGAPGSFDLQACGPDHLAFYAYAGATYAILVFDHQLDGVGTGGTLQLSIDFDVLPPPPTLELTVDAVGAFDARTGAATIRGTAACTGSDLEGEGKSFISVDLSQLVGRFRIGGQGGTELECDGDTHAWSVLVTGWDGSFGGGKAAVTAFAFACGQSGCADAEVNRTVTLRK